MNWNQLLSGKRFGMEEFHEERQENRSEFANMNAPIFSETTTA